MGNNRHLVRPTKNTNKKGILIDTANHAKIKVHVSIITQTWWVTEKG